jgi:hypothetical protein|tara:strand:- start:208 stop:762 length:555 start_codon:yes stop_codon:yes gene_type:complete
MKQESKHSQSSNNSETNPLKKSEHTTMTKSNPELELIKNQDIIISNLIEGKTLTEIVQDKNFPVSQMSLQKFYSILKKNKQLNDSIVEARKIGIQTLIDKLLQIFQYQEVENPNQILWIKEKTKFIQYLAGKLTDLYSDNKPIKQNIDQKISVSWTDTPDLVDLDAALVDDIKDPEPKSNGTGS